MRCRGEQCKDTRSWQNNSKKIVDFLLNLNLFLKQTVALTEDLSLCKQL